MMHCWPRGGHDNASNPYFAYCIADLQSGACQAKLYFDLSVSGKPIVKGMICRDRVKLIRYSYLGFIGDLIFMDTFAKLDPTYDGLGSRYILLYLESSDI